LLSRPPPDNSLHLPLLDPGHAASRLFRRTSLHEFLQHFPFSRENNESCCIDIFMNDTKYLLLGDVARLLHRRPHQIVYLLSSRQVPEPSLRLGNRRVFTAEDVERIRLKLNNKKGIIDE